jgi:3-oxoacyl-[acyl-carrier-protein] synthase III
MTTSSTRIYSRITGTGGCLPGDSISNQTLADRLAQQGIETSDAWIVERTGIRARYFAAPEQMTSDLAVAAAQAALAAAGITADELDLIIVATSTPDMIFPSTACIVQHKLGTKGQACMDVQAVCTGFVYAMATADAYIRCGMAKNALVIGAEVFSRILDFTDRTTCVLFGDGAGAVIMQASDTPGVHSCKLHADGSHLDILCTPGSIHNGNVTGHPFLKMDGQAVFKLAVNVLEKVAREALADAGWQDTDVRWLIPHQANIRIMQSTGKKLKLGEDKLIATVHAHGNTSAASIPLALDVAVRDGRIQRGHQLLLEGVGGGFTWGAIALTY